MKLLIFLLVICLPLLLKSQEDTVYKGIKWDTKLSWDEIKVKAKVEKKYIFVDCYATWCGPCKIMDRDIYPHWRVGTEMNEKYISIKVQMDTSQNDNKQIQNWYEDAHRLMLDYKVNAFPTLLFFTPDGVLVHSEEGFQNLAAFIRLSQMARDPQKPLLYRLYKDYKAGEKIGYNDLKDLAIFTKNLIGDKEGAYAMAKDYKENYLDKLSIDDICTKGNFDLLFYFNNLVNSKDKFFELCYKYPQKVDSIIGEGVADYFIKPTVRREEIENKVLANGKAIARIPDWKKIQKQLQKKYKKIDAKRMILDYQIDYYGDKFRDWSLWAKYKDERMKLYPPKNASEISMFTASELNTGGAWTAFLICPETPVLKRALTWIEWALQLSPDNEAYLDTKANLLYKLGSKEDAILLEEKALKIARENDEAGKRPAGWIKLFEDCLKKMRRDEPTWMQSQSSVFKN